MYVFRCPKCPSHVRLQAVPHAMAECLGVPPHPPLAMELLPDFSSALLPIDPPAGLAPLKVEHLKANGILLPETQHALEWLYRHRETNGMAEAFSKVGGRRCIDLVAFARLMRERR